ncbi:MAG: chondroitinase-B domain-containing protein [Cyclobacteriaceae bacterium]
MKILLQVLTILALLFGCQQNNSLTSVLVQNQAELNSAIKKAKPGTEIVMANGEWNDVQIRFTGNGTEDQPIILRAESPGEVMIQGESDLKLGGEYLVVEGLFFTNGASPSKAVIQYYIDSETVANHSRVTNCVIKDFNKSQRNNSDLWVLFKGRYNQFDQNNLSGKSNRGPTIRIDLEGNQSVKNYHRINNNYFGPRPPKGGPSAETIQIGNSSTSMTPSYTTVENNFFDHCDGEVEVISSKSNFNEFRNNIFYKSEGSLVTRHGNYCLIDGNYFIGDENSPHVGGVRLIGTGHVVTNNYFYNLRGEIFRAPLALMNGVDKPTINRYFQVTDVVVAYNTWVNCSSPWQIGVGSNLDQKDVLPASEIRSETPIRTIIANNIIYNTKGDEEPIRRYDSSDGIDFESNVINNQGVDFKGVDGLEARDFSMTELEADFWVPSDDLSDFEKHNGFEFDKITTDLVGNSRKGSNSIGAVVGAKKQPNIMDLSKYGADWYNRNPTEPEPAKHVVKTAEELVNAISNAADGDIIQLSETQFELNTSLKIDKKLIIQSIDSKNRSTILFKGAARTPAFEMNPKGELKLQAIILKGTGANYAFATLSENMSSLYNLTVKDADIFNFDYVLKSYKYSFSEYIRFESTSIKNCANGIELSAEDDDRGDYNAENVFVLDCQFDRVSSNVIDYYRGGYDESTVGGNLIVQGCTFTNSGEKESTNVLINTYGIINVEILNNTFENNSVDLVARLWGAKNNSQADNVIKNSGKLIVEQNLPLKLMY